MSFTPTITSLTPLPSSTGQWIRMQKAQYTDSQGIARSWEFASRTTTSSSGVDAVVIGNTVRQAGRPASTLLVIQFRPAVNARTIEWPAGLIDGQETVEQAAVRELREETGYVGRVVSRSPVVSADPGMTSANMCLVMVDIELDGKKGEEGEEGEEKEPEQQLDEGEEIQRVRVPLRELHERLEAWAEDGYVVAAKLFHWAAGVKYAMENPELFR